ncbi:MAG: dihydrolipoamide dehydrogenase, partial [Chloroflexi bacterium]|nr:dihydrolipoamide dehydrogenase [Chloroflexota bacterium]
MPSKMLIRSADIAAAAHEGPRLGVASRVDWVDLAASVSRVHETLDEERPEREAALDASERVTFYRDDTRFVAPRELAQARDGGRITAERVVLATGSRPSVPPIPGLDAVPYLTSDDALRLDKQPRRLVIVGGGYVGAELAHFFGSLGTEVAVVEALERLMDAEDREIAEWFTREAERRYEVHLAAKVERLERDAAHGETGVAMVLANGQRIAGDRLVMAPGRRANTDGVGLDAAGVEVDRRGQIAIDKCMQTSAAGTWALVDVTGVMPLKHVAVRQARLLSGALFRGERHAMDYRAIPYSAFSAPQVAGVGRTEEQLHADGTAYRVGRRRYRDTGMGMALREDGLAKVLASPEGAILGGHVVGPYASILIRGLVIAMQCGGGLDAVIEAVHAHPALPQVIEEACRAAAAAEVVRPAGAARGARVG